MNNLTKTRKILGIDPKTNLSGQTVTFRQFDKETREITCEVTIDRRDYLDMGSPQVVTVTVEPGDQLNGAS